MKICTYVLEEHAKKTYKNESYNTRLYAGMAVVVDILRRNGYDVEYAGRDTVHKYDIVLMSITSDCDWWPFIAAGQGDRVLSRGRQGRFADGRTAFRAG